MSFGGILEKLLLRESASPEQICKAIDNHSYVIINYHSDGKDDNTGSRIIMPVAYGLSTASNPVVRAYQPMGDTTSILNKWKLFRLDRISYWEETKKQFEKNDLPQNALQQFNNDGDESMKVVNKLISFNNQLDATNGVNVGPKTKEKVDATINNKAPQTAGERLISLGRKNINNQKANIRVDLDNNKKANAVFNMFTDNTPIASGPREPDQSYKPRNVSGTPEQGDINKQELQDLRQKVQNIDRSDILNNDDIWNMSDYQHKWTDDEIDQADFDQKVMNRELWQNKDLSTNRRKYDRYQNSLDSADRMFKNRKDSGNRILYNMEHENDDLD